MSSPPRPSESLETFKATLILQCFAMVKLFIHAYMVLCRPWTEVEFVVVTTLFIVDVIFVSCAYCENTESLKVQQVCTALSMLFYILMLVIFFLAKSEDRSYEKIVGNEFYFAKVLNSEFAFVTFFVTMIIVLFIQTNLIHDVRMLKDPKYRKKQEERTFCGIKVHRITAAEIV